jgi:hypothetical protein
VLPYLELMFAVPFQRAGARIPESEPAFAFEQGNTPEHWKIECFPFRDDAGWIPFSEMEQGAVHVPIMEQESRM